MNVRLKLMLDPKHELKDGFQAVVIRLTIGTQRSYFSLGIKVKPEDWSEKDTRLKNLTTRKATKKKI